MAKSMKRIHKASSPESASTQAEKFTAAQSAVRAFMVKHGNIVFLGSGTKAEKLKQKFYLLQDAASDAYWTDEMEAAIGGLVKD